MADFNNISSSIILTSLAIGLCLTVFAFLSFYFPKRIVHGEKSDLIFSLTQGILWIFRLVFEVFFPVRVPLYSIENPSNIIVVGVIIIISIYLIPVFLLRRLIII